MAREEILELLRERKSEYISGEEISKILGISRSAVWKQIRALRDLGYEIAGSPKLGYRLISSPDALYPAEISRRLRTRLLGKPVFYFQRTGSTNDVARDLAKKGYPEGTVVVAEEQTAGRGRWQRRWFSPPGTGIWFSLILRPALTPVAVPQLTLVAGVAVARTIFEELGVRPGIKWPNDILLQGKKVCGILVEMEATAEQVHHLILGIGINVNQEQSDFPEELRDSATSLKLATGNRVDRLSFFCRLLENLEAEYLHFSAHGFARARSLWLEYQVTLGRIVRLQEGRDEYWGTAVDLDEEGCLLIRMQGGKIKRCAAGEVSLWESSSGM